MMVQFQIPLSARHKNKKETNWKTRYIFYYLMSIWKKEINSTVRVAEKITGRPLGDFGDPEDIAETAAFLSSNRWVRDWENLPLLQFCDLQGEVYEWSLCWRERWVIVKL